MRVTIFIKNDFPAQLSWMISFNGLAQFDQCVKVGVLLGFSKIFRKQNTFIIPENCGHHLARWWASLEFLRILFIFPVPLQGCLLCLWHPIMNLGHITGDNFVQQSTSTSVVELQEFKYWLKMCIEIRGQLPQYPSLSSPNRAHTMFIVSSFNASEGRLLCSLLCTFVLPFLNWSNQLYIVQTLSRIHIRAKTRVRQAEMRHV